MKWLFVLLLVLNGAFFAWQMQQQGSPVPIPAVAPKAAGERLLLLREVAQRPPAGDAGAPSAPSPGSAAAPAAMVCYSVGPLASRAQAERIGEWFKAAGVETQVRVGEQREPADFLIHLTPEPSVELAQQRLAELAALGIEDYAIAEVGGRPHTPVLGVYRHRAAAERRMAELRGAGLDAQLTTRHGGETEYWLDLTEDSAVPPAPVWDRVAREHPELQRVERRCRQIAPDQVIP